MKKFSKNSFKIGEQRDPACLLSKAKFIVLCKNM
jgi:hypothetical protein